MKHKAVIIFLFALIASCGKEDSKDITFPEAPPEGDKITVLYPNSSQIYEAGKVFYVGWHGLAIEDTVCMDLYRSGDYICNLQSTFGADNILCRIPDTLTTSSRYKVRVCKENNPAIFGFSEEFMILGVSESI